MELFLLQLPEVSIGKFDWSQHKLALNEGLIDQWSTESINHLVNLIMVDSLLAFSNPFLSSCRRNTSDVATKVPMGGDSH